MKDQVLHTVWCNISGEAAGEIWNWVKGLWLLLQHSFNPVCFSLFLYLSFEYSSLKSLDILLFTILMDNFLAAISRSFHFPFHIWGIQGQVCQMTIVAWISHQKYSIAHMKRKETVPFLKNSKVVTALCYFEGRQAQGPSLLMYNLTFAKTDKHSNP